MKQKDNIQSQVIKNIDYLVIGHITIDLINSTERFGGTAVFSGLTAQALGLKTGVITSTSTNLDDIRSENFWIYDKGASHTTTFRNISDGVKRTQYLYHIADPITQTDIPTIKSEPLIIHLGPVTNEVDPNILDLFPNSLKCLTPQGWLRKRNEQNQVVFCEWENYQSYLGKADIAVISLDDVKGDEVMIENMANAIRVFVVTENYRGARVYWNNDVRFLTAPGVKYLDDTGAGDIFATAFFFRYFMTKDPWEAGRFAVQIASWSVSKQYLESIPSAEEIERAKLEVIGG